MRIACTVYINIASMLRRPGSKIDDVDASARRDFGSAQGDVEVLTQRSRCSRYVIVDFTDNSRHPSDPSSRSEQENTADVTRTPRAVTVNNLVRSSCELAARSLWNQEPSIEMRERRSGEQADIEVKNSRFVARSKRTDPRPTARQEFSSQISLDVIVDLFGSSYHCHRSAAAHVLCMTVTSLVPDGIAGTGLGSVSSGRGSAVRKHSKESTNDMTSSMLESILRPFAHVSRQVVSGPRYGHL
ncbi:hypothetical protein SCHPADRAFT_893062 [Schizopora paradoxa]|uniref:Uncharacterized protein n=1 Tax=Schizopora paradoxa TaxID=27342 RepID=A0A0H2RD97_9AGAM|nr:hypothetical protein SCHPADRAFT_893062 [Schizopora paradoxa]